MVRASSSAAGTCGHITIPAPQHICANPFFYAVGTGWAQTSVGLADVSSALTSDGPASASNCVGWFCEANHLIGCHFGRNTVVDG
ncbi:hypothetical protein VTK73DRAFT_6743 [Phialemonium thermophilum]|uniref:Uncharacterized protein n=1 Tax=Phialemonium thermophilum TaxID=223376 RepID=A0ABR3WIT6_9PEZI